MVFLRVLLFVRDAQDIDSFSSKGWPEMDGESGRGSKGKG